MITETMIIEKVAQTNLLVENVNIIIITSIIREYYTFQLTENLLINM